jgi:hypothetical protein
MAEVPLLHTRLICAIRLLIMIIQKVIKGVRDLDDAAVNRIFKTGIVCNWWRTVDPLPRAEVVERLNDRNLLWHQNCYDQPDPMQGGQVFSVNTPFISTTAGTVERDLVSRTNIVTAAWKTALSFATDSWLTDGWLFYCHLFVIGKRAVPMELFSEEVRELNVYPGFSPYQPEGEITAKIVIPTTQIERADFWSLAAARAAMSSGILPTASRTLANPNFLPPDDYNNLRDLLV